MATQTINDLANALLVSIEAEKTAAETAKTASAQPVMRTELGDMMVKVAQTLRAMPADDITFEDIKHFRERYGI